MPSKEVGKSLKASCYNRTLS